MTEEPRGPAGGREAASEGGPSGHEAASEGRRGSPRRMARRASERIPPRAELVEQAAEASRAGLRTRRERIITVARPILQTSVAASLAWLIATEVVGHSQPFFAPISAVVTLGLTVGERRRRAVELAIGVAVGIAIADLLVAAIGSGTWQIGVTCGLAMLAATLVGGGPLLASQAGASAVLVATLQPPDGAFDFDRALDALVGSGTALVVGSLLLPVDPVRLVREGLGPLLDRLAHSPRTRSATRSSTETLARRSGRSPPSAGSMPSTTSSPQRWPRPATPRASRSAAATRSTGSTATWPPWARSGWRSRTCERWRAARCGRSRSTTARRPR